MKVLWAAPALADLDEIESFIATDNPEAAGEVANRIVGATEALVRFPLIGRKGRVEGTRELVVAGTPYILAYLVRRSEIVILAAVHGSRAWPEEFTEE
jgi:toxin ParE1/3/4